MSSTAEGFCDRVDYYPGLNENICRLYLEEQRNSRRMIETKNGVGYVNRYLVRGTDDEQMVRCRIKDPDIGVPVAFRNVPRQRVEVQPVGHLIWLADVTYAWAGSVRTAPPGPPQMFTFSTGGGSATLRQSLSQDNTAGTFTNYGAINYVNGSVRGVNIPTSQFRWTETWLFTYEHLMRALQGAEIPPDEGISCHGSTFSTIKPYNLLELFEQYTGSTNGNPDQSWAAGEPSWGFRGWRSGEVVLNGVIGRLVSNFMVECTFDFHFKRTIQFCFNKEPWNPPDINNSTWMQARGHDYVEYQYTDRPEQKDGQEFLGAVPTGVIIHQTAVQRNFALLQIGIDRPNPSAFAVNKEVDPCAPPVEIERTGDWDTAHCNP